MSLLAQTSTQQLITSSITAKVAQFQTLTSIEAYISSLTVDSLAIGSNSGFINMGDIITTSHSSLQINTGLLTASGVVCTPQMIVSSINGQTISQLATVPVQSTMIGLGTAGYVSTASLQSTFAGINYAISQNTVDTVFYLNPGTPAPTYRQMSPNQTMLPQSTLTTFITKNTSNIPIAQFQTDFTIPQVIPGGAWDINLFSYTDHARTYTYASLFSRAGATETLLASSSNATTNIGISPVQQYTNTLFVPQTIFTSTTGVSLVLKVFANNPINQDDNLYTYYQGGNYSHVHTTFGTVIPDTLFTSTVQGLGSAGYLSTLNNVPLISSLQMNTSSIVARNVSSATGYISSLRTDNLTVGGADGYVTIQDLTTGTASTGQLVAGAGFISSLQINSLSFGPSGYVIVGNFIASSLSTMKLNTQNLYTNNAYIGNVSSQSAILFPGVDATFRGTAVAEQVTGPGTGELLLYKVSTGTDQIRLQTTGNIVFEAGASARSWPSTQTLATPTMYIAGSTSNVGIGTNAPAATLDVVGVVRAQTFSSLALNVSSINGAAPGGGGASFTGSTTTLSSAVINVSSLSSAYIKATQGYISSLTVDYLAIGSNLGFMNMGDIITTSHSSLQINTGIFTASGSVCTSQLIVSSINGAAPGGTFTGSTNYLSAGLIQTPFISTLALNVSSINGATPGGGTPFTGSTISLSSASLFTSSLQASTISVGGGAWMSNDGLYLSNAQAGGAVGKLITNAGYVKLMTATAWNGGYGALAITGGDLTPKVYMGMGTSVAGGNLAIGGLSPSPGGGITLDVFGAARFSSISTFQAVTSSIGVGMANPIFPLDVAGLGRFQILSTLALNVSSINGALPNSGGGGGGTTFVGSTIFLSAAQLLVSTQTNYNLSSVLGYVSSLQVDELQVGSGYGILSFGDTNMSSISTLAIVGGTGQFITLSSLTLNVSSINGLLPGTGSGTSFTGNLGTVSSLTALKYYGLSGLYQNSVVAEVSTGAGTQELLLYKVSSISDQIRVQTTGNVIFEAGVGARGWPTAPRATNPTFYIAGSNSNVGVGTSNPLTTFDVVGTGRFQTLSSLNITAGSINYSIAYV